MQHPQIAAIGENNVGKSLTIDSIIDDPVPIFENRVRECTAIVTTLIRDAEKADAKIYGVMDRDGEMRYAPLSEFATYTPDDNDSRLFFYHSGTTETRLGAAVWIDVPGRASVSKDDHNRRAAEFVADPMNYDIVLDILSPRCTELTATELPTPTPRIVLVNKMDERVNWSVADPIERLEKTVETYRAALLSNVEDGIKPCVIGYSAIVGLASKLLNDALLDRLLQLTKTHGKALLSNNRFFSIRQATQVVDAANEQLTASWWKNAPRPAYPAIRFAIGISMAEAITDAPVLRQRMSALSGCNTLRQTLEKLLPLTERRRELLNISSRYLKDTLKVETELAEIRTLLTDTERLWHKHSTPLASTQEQVYLKKVRAYLGKHASVYSKLSHVTRQAFEDTQRQYAETVNAAVDPAGT